jgi:hypothetical protein
MKEALKPPPTLACTRVLEYAVLDDSVIYSGHSNLFVGNEELGPVPRLAICHDESGPGFFLHHCDEEWNILATERYDTLTKAKASAEGTYFGVSAVWVDAGITEQEATKHLDEIWGGQKCNFCKRRPIDFDNPKFIQKNGAWICDSCVQTCYELLQSDTQGA